MQEEDACLTSFPVNEWNLVRVALHVCTPSSPRHIAELSVSSRSICSALSPFFFSCKAQQRLILDIDTSMFVLLSSFGSNAGVCGAEGIQTLSASITLPFPSAYSPFSRIMQAQLFSPSKGELVFILRFAFARRGSSQRVQTWMFSVQSWTECMWVWNQKPSSHNDTNAASLGKQTPLLYPFFMAGLTVLCVVYMIHLFCCSIRALISFFMGQLVLVFFFFINFAEDWRLLSISLNHVFLECNFCSMLCPDGSGFVVYIHFFFPFYFVNLFSTLVQWEI